MNSFMPEIIKVLPPLIASQIAAGEVIERPASIVKELLENSIDAGSDDIIVTVKKAGNNLISVRDNGSGISKIDLPLSIVQHATSKLSDLSDLEAIRSLGFRGEALASICAVAKLRIISKQETSDVAYCLEAFNNFSEIIPAAHPVGTTIEVSDLFFNTPVRRRFLKADKTEFQHILEIFQKLALSNFQCGFTLVNEDKIIYKLPKANSRAAQDSRVQKIFGSAFIKSASYFVGQAQNITLQGWLGNPDYHRSQSDQQYFFLNNRIIRDKLILHAIRYVYDNIIPNGRHPCYVLYLYLDPSEVDINVHPTKHEVRFCDGRSVHQFIVQQLSKVLLEQNLNQNLSDSSADILNIKENFINFNNNLLPAEKTHRTAELLFNKQINYSTPAQSFGDFFSAVSEVDSGAEIQLIESESEPQLNQIYNFGVIIAGITNSLVITYYEPDHKYYLVDLKTAYCYLCYTELLTKWQENQQLASFDLLQQVSLDNNDQDLNNQDLVKLGFKLKLENNKIIITAVPYLLRLADPKAIFLTAYKNFQSSQHSDLSIFFNKLATLSLGRLEGNLLALEQQEILTKLLAKLTEAEYSQKNFNNKKIFKLLDINAIELLLC